MYIRASNSERGIEGKGTRLAAYLIVDCWHVATYEHACTYHIYPYAMPQAGNLTSSLSLALDFTNLQHRTSFRTFFPGFCHRLSMVIVLLCSGRSSPLLRPPLGAAILRCACLCLCPAIYCSFLNTASSGSSIISACGHRMAFMPLTAAEKLGSSRDVARPKSSAECRPRARRTHA